MKNGIVSPIGFVVMLKALLLGGFVAPLLAFLGAAFIGGALRDKFAGYRRRALPAVRPRRAF